MSYALVLTAALLASGADSVAAPASTVAVPAPTALDRTASAAGAAAGAASGALAGFTVGSVTHILLQVVLPTPLTLSMAANGAPLGAFFGVLILGSPFLDGYGPLWVATAAAGAAGLAQLVVGIPFVVAQGRPFGSYEAGIIPLLVVPPAAAALGAAVTAPFFAAPAE